MVCVTATEPNGNTYYGTGVMVRSDAVITAEHVVKGRKVEVIFPVRDHTGA